MLLEEKKEGGGEEGLEAMVLCLGVERGEGGVSEGLSDDGGVWGCSARTEESGKGAGVAEGWNGTRLTQVHDGERGREREKHGGCLACLGKARHARGEKVTKPRLSLSNETRAHTQTHAKDEGTPAGQTEAEDGQQKQGAHTHAHCLQQRVCGEGVACGVSARVVPVVMCVSLPARPHTTHTQKGKREMEGGKVSRGVRPRHGERGSAEEGRRVLCAAAACALCWNTCYTPRATWARI